MTNTGESLQHFGVLGMKWGVRRQRGTEGLAGSKKASKPLSDEHTRSRELKKKNINTMSNKELQEYITRMNLERQLKQLKAQDISAGRKFVQDISAGRKFVQDAVREVGKELIKEAVKSGVKKGVETAKKARFPS